MIDVRIARADLDGFMHPGVLETFASWGLLRIDLFPPAAGPEVELVFSGDTEEHVERIREKLAGIVRASRRDGLSSLTVLAARLRPAGTEADPPNEPAGPMDPTRRYRITPHPPTTRPRTDRW